MELVNYLVYGYFGLLSLLGFVIMGVDKQKAREKAWRIPERTLLLIAFLGGGLGSLIGMYTFRHKTKHTKFILLVPLATAISLFAAYKLLALI
ncbi:MAG: putative rane protein [Herbinix sp.]|jgi:uncharacterized membrane protein YsdA (DUF1294 family)|nr:putative rane protein [Herbinix sp.]